MCSPRGQPGCDAGQRVRSTYWIPGPLVESRLSGKLLGALSRTLSKGLSKGLSKELSKGLLKGAAQRGPQARAVEAAQSVEAQGEARDRRQAAAWEATGRALVAADGCGTTLGRFWNVRPGGLDLLRLMQPTGEGRLSQYGNGCRDKGRSVLLFAGAVVAPSVAAGSVCTVFQGAEDCSAVFAFPGRMPTVSMPGKKNGHLPRGGVHKSAISRGHSESWFCRPVGPAAQGLGVPGASPRQEGLPWSYETMGRYRVPVRQTNGFWGRSSGTHLVFICSWDQLLGHRRIGSLVHLVSTSGHSGASIRESGNSESEVVGAVGKAGKGRERQGKGKGERARGGSRDRGISRAA